MQLSEIEDNIVSRRNRIFLLMEEVRRLRIQRRLKVKAPTQVPLQMQLKQKECLLRSVTCFTEEHGNHRSVVTFM